MTQVVSSIRAVFQGRYKGGTIHADNGEGKPICYNRNYWDNDRSTVRWETSSDAVSCKHCRKNLAKFQQQSVKKLTLRERMFSGS